MALYYLSVVLRCMVTPLVSFGLSVVLLWMITPLVSFGHCIVCRSFYGVWLPLWYLLAIVLSVCRFTVYDYPFGIFWPLYCLSVVLRCMITSLVSLWPLYCLSVVLRCMITPLVSFGHCIVCRSFYGVWLPLWYLLAIVLSVDRFTVHDYPLVSFGHCIVCRLFYGVWLPLWYLVATVLSVSFYGVWLPLWYLLATVLSVGRFTVYDYPFCICWPLCCLSVCRVTVYDYPFGIVFIVCRSFYGVWLPIWYLLAIVLSVGPFTVYYYLFGIFWPLYCLSFVLRCMITPLVSFGHCIVCRSFYGEWLPLWYILPIVLCRPFYGVWLPLWYRMAIVLSVGRFTVYDYPCGIFWPLYCLSVVLRCMITPLVSFGHCIVCRSFYSIWLPIWYLLAIVLSVGRFTVYDYPFGIVWPLYCLSVVLRYMITHLVSFGHCIVCRSFYGIWLPIWYLLAIVLSVGRFTVYYYLFGIFWPLYCLSVVLRCMITPLVSFGHCIVCLSFYGEWLPLWYILPIVLCRSFYGVWLPLWYRVAIVLSVGRFTVYDYPFGILWPLCCLSVVLRCMITPLVYFGHSIVSVVLRCMITPLVSCGHCIVCRSFYGVCYPFGILWPLCCLSVVLRCMITSLVSFGHCIICRSLYGVWIPLWYLLAIVLSVGRFTVYDYPFGMVWPLYCLSVVLRCMITPLVSFGHCIVCLSFYGVWLPL